MLRQGDERTAEGDLDHAGADDREVLVEREPVGHLRLELRALRGQVEHARTDHRRAEQDTSRVCAFMDASLEVDVGVPITSYFTTW